MVSEIVSVALHDAKPILFQAAETLRLAAAVGGQRALKRAHKILKRVKIAYDGLE
jgi:hypothetical protein